jgi:hypothetical protein
MDETTRGFKLTGRIAFASAVLLIWALFLFVDCRYQLAVEPTSHWPESEWYGPLSFFQPLLKYVAFVLTAAYLVFRR